MAIYDQAITVLNSPPINEGDVVSLRVAWKNSGAAVHTVTIQWGDASSEVHTTAAGTSYSLTYPHIYVIDGKYDVLVTITGSGGSTKTLGTSITINNTAPVVSGSCTIDSTTGLAQLQYSFTDAGTNTSYGVLVDWGDGATTATQVFAEGAYQASHTYSEVSRLAITIQITDSGGGVGTLVVYPAITWDESVDDECQSSESLTGVVSYGTQIDVYAVSSGVVGAFSFITLTDEMVAEVLSQEGVVAVVDVSNVYVPPLRCKQAVGTIPFEQLVPEV